MERKGEGGGRLLEMATAALIGGVISLAVTFILLLLSACAISAGILDEGLSQQIVVVACIVSGYIGGKLVGRKSKETGLWVGLTAGIVFCLMLLTVSLIFFGPSAREKGAALAVAAGCLCGSTLSGIGKKKGKKKRRR